MAYGLRTYEDREDLLDILANITPDKSFVIGKEPNYFNVLKNETNRNKEIERGRLLEKWMNIQKN